MLTCPKRGGWEVPTRPASLWETGRWRSAEAGSQGLGAQEAQVGSDLYNRAERLLEWNLSPLVTGDAVRPVWMRGGKLFLMHGDLDDNVHPAMTLRVADALIKANKSFDFLILPDRSHGLNEPYVIRRRWDYFVEHLMGAKPPVDYQIRRPEG